MLTSATGAEIQVQGLQVPLKCWCQPLTHSAHLQWFYLFLSLLDFKYEV